jgi:hemoglobin-like flavoprotein
MTPKQIELIEKSFQSVKPIADAAGRMFYGRLIELDPSLRPMFRDVNEQARKLMQVIGTAVAMLRRPEELFPIVEDLGRRHVTYGVTDAHYQAGGAALVWTLEQGLGDAFTPEVRDAWVAMYDAITWVMRQGARRAAA